jgi:SAM-dependent methyltransferase
VALFTTTSAFVPSSPRALTIQSQGLRSSVADEAVDSPTDKEITRRKQKQALLGLLGGSSDEKSNTSYDPLLVDPISKEPLAVSVKGPILGGSSASGVSLSLRSSPDSDRVFAGRTDVYINLLEPVNESNSADMDDASNNSKKVSTSPILSSLLTFTPPPLRPLIANLPNSDLEYIPMRDLFTSPSVSFAYERGWRQGFAAAGFPGADKEFEMAREYFAPVMDKKISDSNGMNRGTVVDMSCATGRCYSSGYLLLDLFDSGPQCCVNEFIFVTTGLFTRRFTKSNEYSRVLGCDYSDSMLKEARQRIRADPEIKSSSTRLDLVRCDVAKIPLASNSIDALHAGAAMHCWPEIEQSLKEIYRVLTPGGRYFATTFLGNYFQNVSGLENAANGGIQVEQSMQAFQYFPSIEHLRKLLLDAGFEDAKVDVELVGRSCVIIRCEK